MEQEFTSLDDIIAQRDQAHSQENLLFDSLSLEPVQIVQGEEKGLLKRIGSALSRPYRAVVDYYKSSPAIAITGAISLGMGALLTSIDPYNGMVLTMGGTFSLSAGLVTYGRFKTARDHFLQNGFDGDELEEQLGRFKLGRQGMSLGDQLGAELRYSFLKHAARRAGYLDEFNAWFKGETD